MSGLVGYGSSDEEEDQEEKQVSPSNNVHTLPAQGYDGREPSLQNGDPVSAPMLGPSRPVESVAEPAQNADGGMAGFAGMSNAEILRYLTTPTHAMLELPEPSADSPDPAVAAKFKRFLELKKKNVHLNEDLASKSSFKNPNLLSTLMERAGITGEDQYATTLSEQVFSLNMLPATAFKEELLRSQQRISDEIAAEKKALSAAGKRTIDFAPATTQDISIQEPIAVPVSKRKRP